MAFVSVGTPRKKSSNVRVRKTIQKASNIDAIFHRRSFNTVKRKSLLSLAQYVMPKIEKKTKNWKQTGFLGSVAMDTALRRCPPE
jgi:hypothetical protein